MKELTCNHCSESVVLAERGETITQGETPVEHMERTGHAPRSPRLFKCNDCGNVWGYTGSADTPTCSNCRGKRTESTSTKIMAHDYAVIVQVVASGQEVSKEVDVDSVEKHSDGFLEVREHDPESPGGGVVHRQVTSIRFLNH